MAIAQKRSPGSLAWLARRLANVNKPYLITGPQAAYKYHRWLIPLENLATLQIYAEDVPTWQQMAAKGFHVFETPPTTAQVQAVQEALILDPTLEADRYQRRRMFDGLAFIAPEDLILDLIERARGETSLAEATAEAVRTAYDYLRSNLHRFTIDRSLEDLNAHFQVVNLMQAKEGSQTAAAFFIALFSALVKKSIRPATVILGEITVQGSVLPVADLAECVQLARENGARRVLVPTANAKDIPRIPSELLAGMELAFYSDPKDCLLKALED